MELKSINTSLQQLHPTSCIKTFLITRAPTYHLHYIS